MGRIGARPVVGVGVAVLMGCSATQPMPEHPRAQPAAAAGSPAVYVPMQRDLYTVKLVYLLRHGWRTPEALEAAPMSLKATAELEVDAHGMFARFRLAKSSGNALFDDSVTGHLQALIDSGARADSGPPYIVDHVFGETLTVRFSGPPPPGTPPY